MNLMRVYEILDTFIVRDSCVLLWDETLIEQLPDILRENHGIVGSEGVRRVPMLMELFGMLDPSESMGRDPKALVTLLHRSGIDLSKYDTKCPAERVPQSAESFENFSLRTSHDDERTEDDIRSMQKTLGSGTHLSQEGYPFRVLPRSRLHEYLRNVTTAPPSPDEAKLGVSFWEVMIHAWKLQGYIGRDERSLSIGPRWATEIEFFREILDLPSHIGLDLHTEDSSFIVAGDMHAIPFPDNSFSFVFLKNVIDKSFNFRKLVDELIRVVRPGGIIITEHNTKYTEASGLRGMNTPFTRVEIQHAANLLSVFRGKVAIDELVCEDLDISNLAEGKVENVARAALKVRKGEVAPVRSYVDGGEVLRRERQAIDTRIALEERLLTVARDGLLHLTEDRNETALWLFSDVLRYRPEVSWIQYVKAVAEVRLGKLSQAEDTLRGLIEVDSSNDQARELYNQLKAGAFVSDGMTRE